jgi:TctA family transporter
MSQVLDVNTAPGATEKVTKFLKKALAIATLIVFFVGALTCAMTYRNLGYTSTFYSSWATSFAWSVLVTAPTGSIMSTLMHLYINKVFSKLGEIPKNVIFGVHMAFVMEGIMACVTAGNNVGFKSISGFLGGWLEAFAVALPLGLVLAIALTMTIKPRLVRFLAS